MDNLFLPILIIEDREILTGSFVIARYMAAKFRLCGGDNWESARADMIAQGVADLYPYLTPVVRAVVLGRSEDKKVLSSFFIFAASVTLFQKEAWEWFKTNHLYAFLNSYSSVLENNGTGWFSGSRVL